MSKFLKAALIITQAVFLLGSLAVELAASMVGQVTGLPIPRFITLKANEINLRKGPNSKYPIVWIYKQKGYPMEVVEEFENWRKIRDIDGKEGWVHENLISGTRAVIIKDSKYIRGKPLYINRQHELVLFRYPDEQSYPMLRAEIGVIAKLKQCGQVWCQLKINDINGWARKENLWGVYSDEILK